MATAKVCVVITHQNGLFVGPNEGYIIPMLQEDKENGHEQQKIKKTIWKQLPYGIDGFLEKHSEEREILFKALHYWALCRLKRLTPDENAYGIIKRKLHAFSKDLYRRVRNFATSIAAAFKKSFPSVGKQKKMRKKFWQFMREQNRKVSFANTM